MTPLEQKILDTAKQIDTLKAGSKSPQNTDALCAELPMCKKLSPDRLRMVLDDNSLFEGKSFEDVAKMVQEDDNAREVLMKLIAQAIDSQAQEESDLEATSKMKQEHEASEIPEADGMES